MICDWVVMLLKLGMDKIFEYFLKRSNIISIIVLVLACLMLKNSWDVSGWWPLAYELKWQCYPHKGVRKPV